MAGLNFYVVFCAFAAVLGSIQCGYHIGELNTPKDVISCKSQPNTDHYYSGEYSLPDCIPMNDAQFGLVTSIFTLGALLGSLLSLRVADDKGRRWTLLANNLFLGISPLIMGFARNYFTLVVGRALVGIGCGVVTVVVPMYLAEISPIEYRGAIGTMNQLGIVAGILLAQIEGLYLSNVPGWRLILLSVSVISLVQIIFLGLSVESPRYLISKPGGIHSAKRTLQKLRGSLDIENELGGWNQIASDDDTSRLMPEENVSRNNTDDTNPVISSSSPSVVFHARNHHDDFSVWQFLTSPYYRAPLKVLLLVQFTQQFSGINAVMYYSTTILSKVLPSSSGLITVYINVVNFFMTIVSAYLMDKTGRRTLLLCSIGLMSIASALLGLSIINDFGFLSAFSIILYVATFAIGLGPIPFLIIPEIVDTHAAATAGSIGVSLNWTTNFVVGFLFLSLNNMFGGYVFYVFSIYLFVAFLLSERLVPETKAKTVEEIWSGWTGRVI
ncbi:1912_t:CDS:2 [Diversispora eburnea]|uniref:1912_t:CDS:1 n=1 Tax=Diversispora eburnea TaxID=1213867 RepID=A0A9N8VBF5_9GLOM|nr:1912_t:CDS:2 [Diversispora eburnea]